MGGGHRLNKIAAVGVGIACAAAVSMPLANAGPGTQYVRTGWGTRCQVDAEEVICETCVPGQELNAQASCPDPADEVAVKTSGVLDPNPGGIGAFPVVKQLSDGETYRANGWTVVGGDWARFTNDATGHGMAVAPQNMYAY